jgi:hypothetical protein
MSVEDFFRTIGATGRRRTWAIFKRKFEWLFKYRDESNLNGRKAAEAARFRQSRQGLWNRAFRVWRAFGNRAGWRAANQTHKAAQRAR